MILYNVKMKICDFDTISSISIILHISKFIILSLMEGAVRIMLLSK